ncbi:hypothetical protein CEXT_89431, partial [Caerostris extrusa]
KRNDSKNTDQHNMKNGTVSLLGDRCRIFGFVARKPTSQTDNQCHLFAEHDPDQPASAIVHFVTKVMMTETTQTSQMV